MIPLIAGAVALFSVGKGIYDSYKQNESNKKMQKIAQAKGSGPVSSPQPGPSQPAPSSAAPPMAPVSMGGGGAGMAPMPSATPAATISMPTVNPMAIQPPEQVNPMTTLGNANPSAGIGANPLDMNQPQKQKNPWEQYAPVSY